jgi:hypothetical protein
VLILFDFLIRDGCRLSCGEGLQDAKCQDGRERLGSFRVGGDVILSDNYSIFLFPSFITLIIEMDADSRRREEISRQKGK